MHFKILPLGVLNDIRYKTHISYPFQNSPAIIKQPSMGPTRMPSFYLEKNVLRKYMLPILCYVTILNNSRFGDFVDRIYTIEFEIKDTTYTDRSASYLDLDLHLSRN